MSFILQRVNCDDSSTDDPSPAVGQCVWYDECGKDNTTQKPLNCQYNKPAPPMTNSTGLELLANLCPQFVNHTNNGE